MTPRAMNPHTRALFDQTPVHGIARRRAFVTRSVAVLTGAALLLLAILVFARLDQFFVWSQSLRCVLIGITAIIATMLGARLWIKGRRSHDPQQVVRDMEAANPAAGQQLRTAWELANKPLPANAADDQRTLATKLLSDAGEQVSGSTWDKLVPAFRMGNWSAACGVIALILIAVSVFSPEFRLALRRTVLPLHAPSYTGVAWASVPDHFDVRNPPRIAVTVSGRPAVPQLQVQESGSEEWQTHALTALPDGRTFDAVLAGMTHDFQARVTAGDGATPTHLVRYRPIPRLEETKLTIHFPDYTGLKPEERSGGDARVVEGSTLAWDFRFNTPPERAEWKLASDTSAPQTVPLHGDGATLHAEWKVPPGKFSGVLSVSDRDGATVDSWKYEIIGVADKLPVVELLEPVKDTQATCVAELPVRIRARDDFGVAEVGLIMEAAGEVIWTLEKVIEEKDDRDVFELTRVMLEKVPLTIRDNVKIYAYALDHKPRGGPRSVSAMRAIDIRDFKRIERLGPKGPGGMCVQQLNQLIPLQRVVVSDSHLVKEEAKDEQAEGIVEKCKAIGVKELEVLTKAGTILGEWQENPAVARDDVALLASAHAQMGETNRYLARILTEQAHTSADRALASLLQLRKHMMKILSEGECPCESEKENEIKSLEELAKEAVRIADEEKSVQEQIAPGERKTAVALDSTRRQQEVALADGGELFAAIVMHPKKNENMERLMGAAEKFIRIADERLHDPDYHAAEPPLADAETNLRDLADFIRAMIKEKLADSLKQMANKAKSDAKKCAGDQKTASAGKKPGEGKVPAQGDGKSPADKDDAKKDAGEKTASAGKKPGAGQGDGKQGEGGQKTASAEKKPGTGKGEANAQADAQKQIEQAARNAKLADEILKELQQQAGSGENKGGKEPGDKKGDTGSGLTAADLAALRKRADTGALAKDLQQLAQQADKPGKGAGEKANDKPDGNGAGKSDGKDIAARLEMMAKELNAEAARLNASRLAQLASVRDKARTLRDKTAADPATKAAADEKALIEKLIAQGAKPGQTVVINGKPVTLPPKPGTAPNVPPNDGRRGAGGRLGTDLERFLAEAKRLDDEPIKGLTQQLETEVPLLTMQALDGIIARLDQLMAALPGGVVSQTAQARIPEAHRREIEAFTRNLSDDFGSENK